MDSIKNMKNKIINLNNTIFQRNCVMFLYKSIYNIAINKGQIECVKDSNFNDVKNEDVIINYLNSKFQDDLVNFTEINNMIIECIILDDVIEVIDLFTYNGKLLNKMIYLDRLRELDSLFINAKKFTILKHDRMEKLNNNDCLEYCKYVDAIGIRDLDEMLIFKKTHLIYKSRRTFKFAMIGVADLTKLKKTVIQFTNEFNPEDINDVVYERILNIIKEREPPEEFVKIQTYSKAELLSYYTTNVDNKLEVEIDSKVKEYEQVYVIATYNSQSKQYIPFGYSKYEQWMKSGLDLTIAEQTNVDIVSVPPQLENIKYFNVKLLVESKQPRPIGNIYQCKLLKPLCEIKSENQCNEIDTLKSKSDKNTNLIRIKELLDEVSKKLIINYLIQREPEYVSLKRQLDDVTDKIENMNYYNELSYYDTFQNKRLKKN